MEHFEKTCIKCGAPNTRNGQKYCKECHAESMRDFRRRQRERIIYLEAEVRRLRSILYLKTTANEQQQKN